jgi:hypothetical protein
MPTQVVRRLITAGAAAPAPRLAGGRIGSPWLPKVVIAPHGHVLIALSVLLFAPLLAAPASSQEDPAQRLSSIRIARIDVGNTYLKVTYARPYIRDRVILGPPTAEGGPLVPSGQLWRTGASEATEHTATGPIRVCGERLEAGTCSIFTVPGPSTWTVHFGRELGLDGRGRFVAATETFTPVFRPETAVQALEVPAKGLGEPVDPFTTISEPRGMGTDLVLRWNRTEVRSPSRPTADAVGGTAVIRATRG